MKQETSGLFVTAKTHHMAVGTGGGGAGGGGGAIAPPIFCQPKKFKIVKTTTYKSVYRNMAKYVNSSVDIGNHRYTNEQNCIF